MSDHKTDNEKALEAAMAKLSIQDRERVYAFLCGEINAKPKWWVESGEEPSKKMEK